MSGDISVTEYANREPNILQTARSVATCMTTVTAMGMKNDTVTRMAKVFTAFS